MGGAGAARVRFTGDDLNPCFSRVASRPQEQGIADKVRTVRRPFEILEHTADVGLRAHGRTLPEVYQNAALGMLSLMVDPDSVRPEQEEEIEVQGTDAVDLLVSWLHEILYRFDGRKQVFSSVRVNEATESRLRAALCGESMNLARHRLRAEIKAVTYHGARVDKEANGWVAEVLFDI